MDKVFTVLFFMVIIAVGLGVDHYRAHLCERNGLGNWHSFTQVCEPVRP